MTRYGWQNSTYVIDEFENRTSDMRRWYIVNDEKELLSLSYNWWPKGKIRMTQPDTKDKRQTVPREDTINEKELNEIL